MKKPKGIVPADWFDDPEVEGRERYWNGKYWSNKIRNIGEISPEVFASNEKYLGALLFRAPIKSDGVFIAFLVISGIVIIISAQDTLADISGVPGALLVIPIAALTITWVYILFLIVLIPRRIFDKRKGITKYTKLILDNSDDRQVTTATKFRFGFKAKIATAVILAFFIPPLIALNLPDEFSESDGDKYFEVEQRISKVIVEWNVAATPISEAVQLINNGSMGAAEARQLAGDTSSKFAVIHNKLNDECATIPNYDLNSSGSKFAQAKAYDALKVTCDLLPQESIEILSLVNAQISPTGTQTQIDYHSNQISILIEKEDEQCLNHWMHLNHILPKHKKKPLTG